VRPARTDKNNITAYTRPLITSALLASGFIQLAAPLVLAAEPAGTKIENTATASYEDPNDPTKPLNVISNTVTVEVAEVAGITITPGAVTGGTGSGGAIAAGDTVYFGFTVTNVGNDTTNFNLPGTAKTLGPVNFQTIEYLDPATGAWKPIPAGAASNQLVTKNAAGDGFAPNESLQVRVKATVAAGSTNQDISVFLGNTPGTGLTPAQGDQNISYTPSGGDVFTVDSEGKVGDVAGAPSNGIREASNFLKTTVGVAPKPIQAFATILKTNAYTQGSPTDLTDDRIEYNLKLQVAQTSPDPAKEAGDLAPAPITLNTTSTVNKVLISDAVPVGTIIESASAPAGDGWTVVYTTDATSVLATAANWKTGAIPTDGSVKRIGFIADGPIVKGTVQDNLKLKVKLDPLASIVTSGNGTVANIAQVIGNTIDPSTGLPSVDPTKKVYDESGDQNPNNYEGLTPPTTNTPNDGVAVATNGTDPTGNNTGTGPGGENNELPITNAPRPGVLNGPAGSPTAVGPTNTNDDFTNKSAAIDPAQAKTLTFDTNGNPVAGTGTIDPPAVSFGNTIQNTGKDPETFTLLPNGNPEGLPDGTKVTITNPAGQSATYILAGTTWNTTATSPVTLTVAPGATGNYSVQVDLPTSDQLKGYGVPIVAFVDDATPGFQGTEPSNTTIDRVYTGYLKLKKEARILSGANGSEKQTWTTDNTLLKIALPTDKIEYRISYQNISSSAPAGSNSVQLNARNVTINEDGAADPNNWAATTTHLPGVVYKESNATVTYTPVNSDADLTVSKYTYNVTSDLTPGQSGKFQFTRTVK
jgi:hypothetical protein